MKIKLKKRKKSIKPMERPIEKPVEKKITDKKIIKQTKEKGEKKTEKKEKTKGKSKPKTSKKESEKEKPKKKQKPKEPEVEVKEEEKIIAEKKKIKIMIIDDEQDILFSVTQVLKSSDYEVIGVESGKECFEILQQGKIPDLIILDIMMPIMSGWEVQRRLERNLDWKDIPIIFLTARTTPAAEEMCRRLGRDYVTKPFDVNDLKKRIDKVLEEK